MGVFTLQFGERGARGFPSYTPLSNYKAETPMKGSKRGNPSYTPLSDYKAGYSRRPAPVRIKMK
jgi:hypothetical protein